MVEYDKVAHRIKELIQKYTMRKFEVGEKGLKEIGEANVRKDFLDPLFTALGWHTDDSKEYDSENYVRGVGHADVAVKVSGKPIIYICRGKKVQWSSFTIRKRCPVNFIWSKNLCGLDIRRTASIKLCWDEH